MLSWAEWPPQLHSVADPTKQVAPFTKHKCVLSVEHHPGEIAGLTVPDRVVLPAFAPVPAHQQSAVAAAGPNCTIIIPGQIHVPVTVGDRDDGFAPAVEIPRLIVKADLCAACHHPKVAVGLEADAL